MKLPNTHWIWLPDWKELVDDTPCLVYFRKSFTLSQIPSTKKIRISADTRYKLYVNGKLAELGPARGDNKVWYYDEVELAPFLRIGENVLAVEVLRYPLAYRAGNFGMFRTTTPGLFLEELPNDDKQPKNEPLIADEGWKCCLAKGFELMAEATGYAPLMYLEKREGRAEYRNWKDGGYDDTDWQYAKPYNVMQISEASCPGDLSERPVPYLIKKPGKFTGVAEKEEESVQRDWNALVSGNKAVKIPAGEKRQVELNAGEEMCGYLSLRMTGGKGSVVKILTSECYVQEGKAENGSPDMPLKGDRCDWVKGHLQGFTDIYFAGGYGDEQQPEIYEPFWFRTFRFVRLEIEAGIEDCIITGFDYLETGYPLKAVTEASASDQSFPAIWDISLRTLRRCMHETYEDCPFYEQLQYAMDSRNEILYTYMVSADDRLARQCMDDFRRSQRADGMINCCYPHYGPNVIPGFSVYYILMVHDHMMFFGDKKLVRHHLAAIDQILEYFDDHMEQRGIVGKTGGHISGRYWSFIDWAIPWGKTVGTPPAGFKDPITMESMLYVYGLQNAAELCGYVGRKDTAEEYRRRAESVIAAVRSNCRDEEGSFLDGPGIRDYSQHCQVFAILTGMVSKEEGRVLLQRSLDDKEKYAQCTVSMAFYLFRALEITGLYERTNEIWNIWRKMVKDNLTTCVENDLDGRSDCHAWGALLLYELPATILGVRPAAPGFEKIEIAPNPGYLNWAKGRVATKWGIIEVDWKKKEDQTLEISFDAPAEVKERVVVRRI